MVAHRVGHVTTQLGNHTQAMLVAWEPFYSISSSTPPIPSPPHPPHRPDTSASSAPYLLETPMTSLTPAHTHPLVQSRYLWPL